MRKLFRMTNGFNGQINVKFGPVQMVCRGEFDVQELADRNLSKPGEPREREEQLLIVQQEPEAMLGEAVTSTGKVLMPGAADVILVLLN
jgi:hypothetical protein